MVVEVSSLEKGVSCVYKITYPNNKVYVGCSKDLRRRMWEHNGTKKRTLNDSAIEEFGKVEEVEILYLSDDVDELEEVESHWIEKLDATNPDKGYNVLTYGSSAGKKGSSSWRSKLTDGEVFSIRERKSKGERKKDVYADYEDKISFSGFENIWLGTGYSYILPEVNELFCKRTKSEKISDANKGDGNGRAKLTCKDVLKIRALYDGGMRAFEVGKLYPQVSQSQIRRICKRETWKQV